MKGDTKWDIPVSQQMKYIKALTEELATLRARSGISQGDLAKVIGVSRQTYSSIECGNRLMSWSTYLSLILFYDYNNATRKLLRSSDAFPEEMLKAFNDGKSVAGDSLLAEIPDSVTSKLDDAAYQAIRTVIMLEYARCAKLPGDAVVKAFDGIAFRKPEKNEKAANALKAIRESRRADSEE